MAELIARVVIDSLAWPASGHDANDHSYAMIMLSTAEKLLFAERHVASTQSTLIITFNRLGGTRAVLDLYARFAQLATEVFPVDGDGGVEVAARRNLGVSFIWASPSLWTGACWEDTRTRRMLRPRHKHRPVLSRRRKSSREPREKAAAG